MALKKGYWSLMFRRIWLLIWKNILLRRTNFIITGFDILLPLFLALLVVFFKIDGQGTSFNPDGSAANFRYRTESDMMHSTSKAFKDGFIAYAPSNSEIDAIMDEVIKYLPNDTDTSWNSYSYSYSYSSSRNEKPKPEKKGYEDEDEIQRHISDDNIKVAVVFTSGIQGKRYGPKISYTIRMVSDRRDRDGRQWKGQWDLKDPNELYPTVQAAGPNRVNVKLYAKSGFSGLQIAIDKVLIHRITKKNITHLPQIHTRAFPFPPHKLTPQNMEGIYMLIFPNFLVIGFMFMVPAIMRTVMPEKQTGIKELMKMMGLPNWMHWVGWMITSLVMQMISITLVIIVYFIPFNFRGAFLVHSNPTVWWIAFVLYAMAAISFCFFISTLIQRVYVALIVGILLWFVTYYAITIPVDLNYESLTLGKKLAASLAPNAALHLIVKTMCALEIRGVGAGWSNMYEPLSPVDELSVGWVCFMLIVDTILYMTLAIYFENIVPSKYGVRKPFYYIFQPSTWFCCGKTTSSKVAAAKNPSSSNEDAEAELKHGFEAEPKGVVPSVIINNLTKIFGRGKMAVDGISLKIYDGEITALLGHNGAGKTTTMSMLTGLYAPTSGTAFVSGHNINTEMDEVRQNLGLCPQHNMLFDSLSVSENLIFFGRLKGLKKSEAEAETMSLLGKLQLANQKKVPADELSGGQKRKLSLGIALIGGTKVVVLDEPTSGMDPEARRAIWDLLMQFRGERTILITTHFMEEADVLGDKIAIMSSGKIKCHGSPMFLKKSFGAGYKLKVTITEQNSGPTSEDQPIFATVQKYVPTASCKVQQKHLQTELEIVLPNEKEVTKTFPDMFAELEQSKQQFGIQTIGLGLTTMDDVFIKVGELDDLGSDEFKNTQDGASLARNVTQRQPEVSIMKRRGLLLGVGQFNGLLIKQMKCTLRNWILLFWQIFIPLLLLFLTIVICNKILEPSDSSEPSTTKGKMSLKIYKNAKTPFAYTDTTYLEAYKKVIGSTGSKVSHPIIDSLKVLGNDNLAYYRNNYIVGAEFNTSTNVTALFSSIPYHSSPLALNLMSNAILKSLPGGKDLSIEMTIHPIKGISNSDKESQAPNSIPGHPRSPEMYLSVFTFSILFPLGLALFTTGCIINPIEERLCKAKQLQLMTGVNPTIYWICSLLWDFGLMAVLIGLLLACFAIFQIYEAYTANGGYGVLFLIFAAFGFSAIPFSYLFSFAVSSVGGGVALVFVLHVLSAWLLPIIVWGIRLSEDGGINPTRIASNTALWLGRPFPAFNLVNALKRYITIAITNGRCSFLSENSKKAICHVHADDLTANSHHGRRLYAFERQCCRNCDLFGDCFSPQSYLNWTDTGIITYRFEEIAGVGQEIFYLMLPGIFYIILIILIEYGIIKIVLGFICKQQKQNFPMNATDDEVIAEKQRIQELVQQRHTSEEAFVVESLCKNYGTFAAVANLSFGVHYGECFGLLGVNGAGKTTSFRMLTGDEIRSEGNAYIMRYSLARNRKDFLGSVGYCPQFDGIVDVLTGGEMLQLFGRLRGVKQLNKEVDKWLNVLGLFKSKNVQCGNYSGGMKRRLSAGMAMIGDPPVILLDEPTSGVDPIARRKFWEVINAVKETGQAIILTSHSMDECETLCSRLGIMVNGEFQCFGGVQHLKNKYAQGFSLVIKLKSLIPEGSPELEGFCNDIMARFNPAVLKDRHQNMLQYQLLNTAIPWDALFGIMEELKTKYEDLIEDYSINETTLEEVFLSFARLQYPARTATVSCCKCCS